MRYNIKEVENIYRYMSNIHDKLYMGIYILKINDIYYVGETINYSSRFRGHIRDLQKGVHHNFTLQKEYNKTHDINNIICYIDPMYTKERKFYSDFELLLSNIMLLAYEKYTILSLKSNGKNVINIENTYNKIYNKASNELAQIMDLIYFIICENYKETMKTIYDYIMSICDEFSFDKDTLIAEFHQLRNMKT